MRILGLINARAGSRGVPGKNLRRLGGRPLVAWTVDAARASRRLTSVVLSTEDAAIAAAGRASGAEVPFMRQASLAGDAVRQVDVALDALDRLEAAGRGFDLLVLLQPTAPFRTAADIDATIDAAGSGNEAYAISVSPVAEGAHPNYLYRLRGGRAEAFVDLPGGGGQRQGFEPLFRRNGAVYAIAPALLRARKSFQGPGAAVHVMPELRGVNIDTPLDWLWAEFIVERGLLEGDAASPSTPNPVQ